MGFPILVRAVLDRIPKVVLNRAFAVAIHRKGGSRTGASSEGLAGSLPIPILSLEGNKGSGCSLELQSLIEAYRGAIATTDEQAAEDALIGYIENALGETIEEAFPDEWEAALTGENPQFEIDLGTDVVTITLGICPITTSEAENPCQVELLSLANAVNANPTNYNTLRLRFFLENQIGKPIEEIVPFWDDVFDDGEQRTTTVAVCGALLVITISGILNTTSTCAPLHSYSVEFPQNDFDLPITISNTRDWDASYPFAWGSDKVFPHQTVHLEDPEFVWMNPIDHKLLVAAQQKRNYFFGFPTNTTNPTRQWYAYLRIKGRWTCKIGYGRSDSWNISVGGVPFYFNTRYEYFTLFPIMGFRQVTRYVEGVDPAIIPPGGAYVTVPPRVGSSSRGSLSSPSSNQLNFSVDGDLPRADGISYMNSPNVEVSPGNQSPFTSDTYWLPTFAIGPPTNPASSIPWANNSITRALRFDSQLRSSESLAWTEFMNTINLYLAHQSTYDPILTLHEDEMEISVSFENDDNAMYLPIPGCEGDEPLTSYNFWSVVWGNWWHDDGKGTLMPPGGLYDSPTTNVPGNYQSAPLEFGRSGTEGDEYGFAANGQGQWLNGACYRIHHPALYPEGVANVGWMYTEPKRILGDSAGTYTPLIETGLAGEVCPKDARCITPGPP